MLEVGECVQVRLGFKPDACGVYQGEMEVDMGDGVDPIVVGLRGEGVELPVGLATGETEMLPTFIHKTTQRTFKVVNHGDQAVRFEVKQLADAYLEEETRLRATARFGDTLRSLSDGEYGDASGGAATTSGGDGGRRGGGF